MHRIGLIVNPIAGMGGSVGLKGTDGIEILKKAIELGAKPISPRRAEIFLSHLNSFKDEIELIVGFGSMGESLVRKFGFKHIVIGERKEYTSAEDTICIARTIKKMDAELLVFCGGDGTARDILNAIGLEIPVLGVPSGVKMHSAVFASNPISAANIVAKFISNGLPLREAEVMDVDEEAFRDGRLSAKLYGYLLVPHEPLLIQCTKLPTMENDLRNLAAIAVYIIEKMDSDTIYIIGPGTTTKAIADILDEDKTLLGVDVFLNKKNILKDVNEGQLLNTINGRKAHIIVTPIGGQGFIFGRGNQQISPKVIRKIGLDNITVIATKSKMNNIKFLRVDTGDPSLDEEFHKHGVRVVLDYSMEKFMEVK
ncbi:MAG: ATP-NAD kinase family protein [Candidatus Methanomethyliaceae archaeon]|nr:ATP-NAD kinase family protein [Candidatus Methanomethyliaceae archaeon]MCX8169682.1 ATP-NAD kinase family protein [Candidatus Methanomethyliaceae archaeon]